MFSYTDLDDFPNQIQLISDTDVPVSANFSTGPEGLANRTRWLKNRRAQWKSQTFTGSGTTTWFVPNTGTTFAIAVMYGGGGGGGGSMGGALVIDSSAPGGGGGGGSIQVTKHCPIAPGVTFLNVGIGAGGVGGNPGPAANHTSGGAGGVGGNGGESVIVDSLSNVLARAFGGQGGSGGGQAGAAKAVLSGSDASYAFGRGGAPVSNVLVSVSGSPSAARITTEQALFLLSDSQRPFDKYFTDTPSAGGNGVSNNVPIALVPRGNPSAQGFFGGGVDGAAPEMGADGGSYRGGGCGGGGGGGPAGVGADGGPGGDANGSGSGSIGYNGNSASAANTGAGGGGGGGSGCGTNPQPAGAFGGNGSPGKVILYWIEYGT